MKKVVVIFPKYDPDDGSHYPYWYDIFQKVQKELDIFLLFETNSKNPPAGLRSASSFDKGDFQRVSIKPFNLLERFWLLIKLRKQGYEHFYVHYSIWSLYLAKIVTLLFGGKTYLWDCEYYEKLPGNYWQRLAIRWCDVLVTGHQKIGRQYRKVMNMPEKRVKVVRNWVGSNDGVTSDKLQVTKGKNVTRHPSPVTNILFVHHLSERKGSRQLIEIIERLEARSKKQEVSNKDIQFVIVGDGPDLDNLKLQVKSLQLENNVIFKGRLGSKQVEQEFAQADLFIMPSRTEGFPRVILEAQKYGVPYVATDVGCVKEITPKSLQQNIVEVGDIDTFVDRMVDILKLCNKGIEKLQKDMYQNVQHFSLFQAEKEFVAVFSHDKKE